MGLTIDDFIAGWLGGVTGLIVGHPLDTIKVREQTYGTNIVVSIKRTLKHEGLPGFYRGVLFPLLTVGPSNAVFFGTYGNVLHLFQKSEKRTHSISYYDAWSIEQVYIAGCVAGFVQAIVTCPIELVKTVLQAKIEGKGSWKKHYQVPYTSSFQTLKWILREQGAAGLYRGITPMLLRDVPTSGIYILSYELMLYSNFAQCATPVLIKQIIAGGIAGVLSWVPVLPIDVVKSRMQVEDPADPNFKKFTVAFKTLLKTRGPKVFYRGLAPLFIQSFIKNAAVFVGYETYFKVLY